MSIRYRKQPKRANLRVTAHKEEIERDQGRKFIQRDNNRELPKPREYQLSNARRLQDAKQISAKENYVDAYNNQAPKGQGQRKAPKSSKRKEINNI